MIISPGRRYVFVHIPKTGGTSLALALEDRAKKDDIMLGDTPKARKRRRRLKGVQTRGRLWKHSTLADIDGLLPPGELEQLFAFTMVRNPWDRAVSYYHWLRGQSFDHPAVRLAQELDFGWFLADPYIAQSLRSGQAASYMTRVDGVEQCAAYIRVEHFATDAAPLFERLGFHLELPHINRSDRAEGYQQYYDDRLIRLVADYCGPDIDRFGYRFEG